MPGPSSSILHRLKKQRQGLDVDRPLGHTGLESVVKSGEKSRKRKDKTEDTTVPSKISRKILEQAEQQRAEAWDDEDVAAVSSGSNIIATPSGETATPAAFEGFRESDSDASSSADSADWSDASEWDVGQDTAEMLDNAAERRAKGKAVLESLALVQQQNKLADPLKTQKKKTVSEVRAAHDPRVIETYTKCGVLLSRYKSGKIPKPMKFLPALDNPYSLLGYTLPAQWTPHAVREMTKIFASNLNPDKAKRFYEVVLLTHVRNDIAEHGKLNRALYDALAKSLYKPAAFFRGFLFPLVNEACTLREAAIIGSVISRVSIPMLHSSVALLKMCEMEYTGPTSVFIRVLVDKKYALPFAVVDALVAHFIRLAHPDPHVLKRMGLDSLPVLWHQSFLVFVQRYKEDLTPDQKDALLDVLRLQNHKDISPEIKRELVNSTCRDEAMEL